MLPAYAGMILDEANSCRSDAGAPRVCGDDPDYTTTAKWHDAVLPAYAGMIPMTSSGMRAT